MIEIITWHNQPILRLTDDTNDKVKAQFGLKKALLIIKNYEAIKQFVQDHLET